jgi:hypothetical protein
MATMARAAAPLVLAPPAPPSPLVVGDGDPDAPLAPPLPAFEPLCPAVPPSAPVTAIGLRPHATANTQETTTPQAKSFRMHTW